MTLAECYTLTGSRVGAACQGVADLLGLDGMDGHSTHTSPRCNCIHMVRPTRDMPTHAAQPLSSHLLSPQAATCRENTQRPAMGEDLSKKGNHADPVLEPPLGCVIPLPHLTLWSSSPWVSHTAAASDPVVAPPPGCVIPLPHLTLWSRLRLGVSYRALICHAPTRCAPPRGHPRTQQAARAHTPHPRLAPLAAARPGSQ